MNISESESIAMGPGDEGPASARAVQPEVASRSKVIEAKLRARFEKWATDIGYWGEATTAAVNETIATDYSPPQTTATFRLGSLSFHCIQNEETDEFRVKLKGSRISDIRDLPTLHRAIRESEHSSTRPER